MELKVGMQVRTEKGYIAKILGVDYLLDDNGCELNNIEAVYLDKMVDEIGKDIYAGCVSQVFKKCRVRDNLIDLIEVGDYVNGDKVTEEMIKMRDKQGVFGLPDKHRVFIDEIKVKNIVTKEQFASVKYEVE